jgi:hypothetical protein
MSQRLSRPDFRRWAEAQPHGRYERVARAAVGKTPQPWANTVG